MRPTRVARGQPARTRAGTLAIQIGSQISSGRFGPGVWLRQIDLEAEYRASRLDVRQALDHLVEKGVVQRVNNRGYRVLEVDLRTLRETVRTRAALEVFALEELEPRLDQLNLPELRRRAERFAAAVEAGSAAERETANWNFHGCMLQACPNRQLVRMIFELRQWEGLVALRRQSTPGMLAQDVAEHHAMTDLLGQGNLAGTKDILRQHILRSVDELC